MTNVETDLDCTASIPLTVGALQVQIVTRFYACAAARDLTR